MPRYQLKLAYADGHEASQDHYAYSMLRVGDRILLAADEWRVERTRPADDWRYAAKLECRLEGQDA